MEDTLQKIKLHIEALLFAAEGPLEVSEIRTHLGEVSLAEVRLALRDLGKDYENRAFSVFEFGGKYQLRTREEYADIVSKQFVSKPRSLSKSALETLAIVAYQQPVTRAQVSSVRGVDSAAIVQSLKDRDLIYVSGTRKEVGSPLEYRTTTKFLEVFGLSKLEDLPNLRSLQMSADDQKQVSKALASANGVEEPLPTAQELSFMDAEVVPNETSPMEFEPENQEDEVQVQTQESEQEQSSEISIKIEEPEAPERIEGATAFDSESADLNASEEPPVEHAPQELKNDAKEEELSL